MQKLIQKNKYLILIAICIFGLFLRFFMLNSNPPSLNWDEASTGYNAYSILKTGKDEYGNFLPLSIRSFDDYKPPLYTYLDIPFIAFLGLNELAVRFPSALLGTLTIPVIYFLILEFLSHEKKKDGFNLSDYKIETALIGALFFAVSPWSLQFSRASYEGNIGLFFLTFGLLTFLKAIQKNVYFYLSSVLFVLSMYSYHSFRLVVPVLLIFMAVIFYKEILKHKKAVVVSVSVLVLLVIPIFYSFLYSGTSGTGSRLSMVTIFGPSPNLDHSITELEYDQTHHDLLGEFLHNRRIVYLLAVAKGYLDHYNPDFLFLHGDGGRQHHAVDMGMLYLFDLPLMLLGFIVVSKHLNKRILLLFSFLLIAPLPAAITTGTPHPVRAIAMLPNIIVLSSIGFVFLIYLISRVKISKYNPVVKNLLFLAVFAVAAMNFTYYIHQYYVHTPVEYGDFWQYGYKEALVYAHANEKNYDSIIMTYKYDQPYVYYLFYNKIDPSWYQKNWNFTGNGEMPRFERKIGKYDFRIVNYGEDQKLKNTLLIGSPDEIPKDKSIKTINFLNGQEAFRIAKT